MSAKTDDEIFEEWFLRTRDMGPDGYTPDRKHGPTWCASRAGFNFALSLVSAEREQARAVAADLDEARAKLKVIHRRAQKAEGELTKIRAGLNAWASPERQKEAASSDRIMSAVAKARTRRRP